MTKKTGTGSKLAIQPSLPEEIERLLRSFGTNVRAARKVAGLTQAQVSEQCGIAQRDISAIKLGKANSTLRTVERLSAVLGRSAVDLLKL